VLKESPFHPRTSALMEGFAWRRWAGYTMASVYELTHEREYHAVRSSAALFDVTPLYKYLIRGRDAARLLDRIVTRDVGKSKVGQVLYTPWCDARGKVIDDGTVSRLDETTFRMTSADPTMRWLHLNGSGLECTIEDVSERIGALSLQGPLSRTILEHASEQDLSGLKYFRLTTAKIRGETVTISRTGYTGDLGYEIWIEGEAALDLWDALWEAGEPFQLRPAGIRALDVSRVEAGLILIEADYTSARHAIGAEQEYSPFEIGLGRLVDFGKREFVGRRALELEQAAGGPDRRLVGIEIDWNGIETMFADHDQPPSVSAMVQRDPVPLFGGGRQIGRATSVVWGPTIKKMVGFGSVPPSRASIGTRLSIEWSVEGERGKVGATVVETPFLDLPRKRA
jgi:aminomethyltransferase